MKTKWTCGLILPMAAGGLLLIAGCTVQTYGPGASVEVTAPEAVVTVPDYYVWDGVEYVGWVGGSYFYLGPGNVWVGCPPFVLDRFHVWAGGHPDWRAHAVLNERFRTDAHGRVQPMRAHAERAPGHAEPARAGEHPAPARAGEHPAEAHKEPAKAPPHKTAPPKKEEHHEDNH